MNILVTAPYDHQKINELSKYGKVIYKSWKLHGKGYNEDEVINLLKISEADAYITEVDEITSKVLEQNKQLKFIGVCRANPVNVDIESASKLNIPIFNTPARNAQAVAELFVGNVISFYRNLVQSNLWLKEGKWSEGSLSAYLDFKGNELAKKKIGFIGFGAVGQTIARMVESFECDVTYYDPFVTEFNNYKSIKIEEIFRTCDIVSVHLPVNDSTKNLIGEELLSQMKNDALFVNTARSAVVDSRALIKTLKNKCIKGAIIDVFDNEPPSETDYDLIKLPNVLATPHIAGATFEVENHHAVIMNNNIDEWLRNGNFKNLFNNNRLNLVKE